MKLFNTIAIATALLAVNFAHAQPPAEVIVPDVVSLQPGEPKTYEFAESVSRIGTGVEGVVAITAHTDRTFTIQGIAPGQAMVVAQNAAGDIVHRMLVDVEYEGKIIRIYAPGLKSGQDYTSYRCTPHSGCGRPNPDLKKAASKASEVEVEETKRTPNGGAITTRTRRYEDE